MILLTIIAVGLLTLASVTLRTTSRDADTATARANARLALMLAIGELQKSAGPDQRITAPANLVDAKAPDGITGVWKSWRPSLQSPDYATAKTGENFLGYLMSNPDQTTAPDGGHIPSSAAMQQLVGHQSAGSTDPEALISVPEVPIANARNGKTSGAIAYITLDEGVKGRIDLLPEDTPESLGESIASVGSPARNGFESTQNLGFLNADRGQLEKVLPKLLTLTQAALPGSDKNAIAPYFHDFTVSSATLQTDVVNGGLKTDLSVLFDGQYGAPVPAPFSERYIFSDDSSPMLGTSMNADVKWDIFANYSRLYRQTDPNNNPFDGITARLPSGYELRSIDLETRGTRYEANMAQLMEPMLMPTVLRVDTIFSLITRDGHGNHYIKAFPYLLHLMYLPVITLHNPYNVPLRVNDLEVEFSDIPIGFEFLVNGQPATTNRMTALNQFYYRQQNQGKRKTFNMKLSNSLTAGEVVIMGPGETRIFGTPFEPTTRWVDEVNDNGQATGLMFDYLSNQTAAAVTKPGLITAPNVGVGFDIDWLAPGTLAGWLKARQRIQEGVIQLKADDLIQVRYGPLAPPTAGNIFSITLRKSGTEYSKTQMFYKNDSRLTEIMEEGTSIRFPDPRDFPETCPRATQAPMTAKSLYEPNNRAIKDYDNSRPFAIFSVSAKTTMESFTKSRPIADTGIAFQSATCNFTSSASAGNSPLEFAMVPITPSSAIESGGLADNNNTSLQAFFFGGHGSQRGVTNAIIHEIPLAPLQSLAQLRNANPGSIASAPYVTYTVGESRAHPGSPSDQADAKSSSTRAALDKTWLANDQLWDKYFFSTLSTLEGKAYTGGSASSQQDLASKFLDGSRRLPNPRNVARIPVGETATNAASAMLETNTEFPFTRTAEFLLTRGGFNVNSTSVAAWTSVLSALSDADIPLVNGETEANPAGTPFLRVRRTVANSGLTTQEKLWNGYRTLDDSEITNLAEEIVKEVRERGPFLSMSEFVNRRLGSASDEKSQKGAIQAALDKTDINDVMLADALDISSPDVSTYDWKNPDAVQGNTGAGAPGEISQGDVLSAVGSFISVRSDTFRIRAFGDARDANGKVTARAWCEATLQRVPEFVDPSDAASATPAAPTNLIFGRRFEIVSFRWLSKNDI